MASRLECFLYSGTAESHSGRGRGPEAGLNPQKAGSLRGCFSAVVSGCSGVDAEFRHAVCTMLTWRL